MITKKSGIEHGAQREPRLVALLLLRRAAVSGPVGHAAPRIRMSPSISCTS